MRTLPPTMARFRSARASFSEGSRRARSRSSFRETARASPGVQTSLRFAEATHHEADVGIPGEGRRLEHALHDQSWHPLIDLKHRNAGKLFAGVDLLPELSLVLENV